MHDDQALQIAANLQRQINAANAMIISRAIEHIRNGNTDHGVELLRKVQSSLMNSTEEHRT